MHSQLILSRGQLQVLWGQIVHYTILITFSVPGITEAGNDHQICSSLMPLEVNSISLYMFLCLYLLRQLLWVQTHSSSGPCKQLTIQLQTSFIHKAQTLVLSTGRSRWSTSSNMWRVVIKKCKVCNKEFSSTQKLKSHIRATHCHSAAYKCSTCSKPFGDPYALSVHKRVHTASARKHICAYCGNAYLSKSKLTDHEKKHTIGHLTCHHCHKLFAEKKGLVDHLKICKICTQL